ncbi:MAG: FAD-linked oxidase C-terminal domain-containing protein, partial [Rhodothermales bacterium]
RATFGPLDDDELARRLRLDGLEGDIYRGISGLVADETNRGHIIDGTPRHWRRCGGYNLDRFVGDAVSFRLPRDERFNLAKLVCGAEGTLAVITDVKLNLVPVPENPALAIVHFDRLYDALSAVPAILEVDPTAVELLDNKGLTRCRENLQYARLLDRFIEGRPDCVLITEFTGENEKELRAKIDALRDHLRRRSAGATAVTPAIERERQDDVWTVRKVGLGLLMGEPGDYKPIPFIEDAAVPPEHLAAYVTQVEDFCHGLGTEVAYYAHASAGCVHIRPLINAKKAKEVTKLSEIIAFSVELLHGYGGSLSSEHGDGRVRSWMNERFFGPKLYGLYQDVKRTFDPGNLLNPGNVVDAPPVEADLRYGEDYAFVPIETHLDFGPELGFDRAVEMCNGAGICRKKTTGTMCPSFMATREEEHSTRGRANALRAALSGRLPVEEFTSERMHQVMDLCIECKACKAECPSNVDMAKIKFEFLAHYHEKHGVPRRSRLFANVARQSRRASGAMAPVANAVMRSSAVRAMMERTLGISRERELPPFASEPFTDWFERHQASNRRGDAVASGNGATTTAADRTGNESARRAESNGRGARPRVVLFNDTFNTYNTPHVAIAATEVLEAAGFEVVLPGHFCCGRPMISKGLVDEARAAAADTVAHLHAFAEEGLPIVGLEPSCLLSLRDEYAYLLPDDPRVPRVAERAVMFEEFVASLAEEGRLDLTFKNDTRRVLLHGHCHQKALVGTKPSRNVLSLPGGYTVEEVDSGCCGMAGSFGYETEHYDLSIKMAERRLLPAVRKAGEQTIVAAAGASCRAQVKHGTGRTAMHPAEILRDALQ